MTAHSPDNTALLVMDMQAGILPRVPDAPALLAKVAKAISAARKEKIPVIYITVGFRAGALEVSPNNKSFSAGKALYETMDMTQFMAIDPAIAPLQGDAHVVKRRVSAFTGSDLEVLLRSQGIHHLVLAGISTSGVVLSTLREAADKDYRLTVLADCCVDPDPEVHQVLMAKVFPRQAEVISSADWLK